MESDNWPIIIIRRKKLDLCYGTNNNWRKTCIGKDTYLITGSHNISSTNFELTTKPINIGDCCWLTTGVTVLPGVEIGNYSVIAANSTVTRDVNSWSVVGGNPAKFIKKREIKNA